MTKRIEVGEKVYGYPYKGRFIKVPGILKQRPSDNYEPYLIQAEGDSKGILTPVYKVRRV